MPVSSESPSWSSLFSASSFPPVFRGSDFQATDFLFSRSPPRDVSLSEFAVQLLSSARALFVIPCVPLVSSVLLF